MLLKSESSESHWENPCGFKQVQNFALYMSLHFCVSFAHCVEFSEAMTVQSKSKFEA